uniref:Carbohydrate sulfotransferase 13 n=1 Tax=Ursus americanus TaxID=9643 RepID=A0A452SKW7_URSAM
MCHEKGCFGRCRRGCCLFHLIPLSLRPIAFENSLGSGWLGGKKRSPLQMLYDLDQGPRSALAEVHRQRRDLLGRRLLGAEDLGTCWWTTRRPAPTATCPRWPAPTWKRVLLALSATPGGRPARHPRAPRRHAPARLPSLATSPRPRSNRRLCAPTWPSFFVREPFERWRRAYANKFARARTPSATRAACATTWSASSRRWRRTRPSCWAWWAPRLGLHPTGPGLRAAHLRRLCASVPACHLMLASSDCASWQALLQTLGGEALNY